jgi:hypothetical protein
MCPVSQAHIYTHTKNTLLSTPSATHSQFPTPRIEGWSINRIGGCHCWSILNNCFRLDTKDPFQ